MSYPTTPPILFSEINIKDNLKLYAINIESISEPLGMYIDEKLVSICRGKRNLHIDTVKKDLIKFLEGKKKSNLLTGAVSEFFVHLFMNCIEYKQECLFFNLEGNDIKKGFDGYYSKDDIDWILESKATINTSNKHDYTINKSYTGIRQKIETIDSGNNPWENAYNHASLPAINSTSDLLKKLDALSEAYSNDVYGKIEDHNIIVASTIFLDKSYIEHSIPELTSIVTDYMGDKDFKNAIILCLNKNSRMQLLQHLKVTLNGNNGEKQAK